MSPWLRFLALRSSRNLAPICIAEDYIKQVPRERCAANPKGNKI
jgi:hypothetical protein